MLSENPFLMSILIACFLWASYFSFYVVEKFFVSKDWIKPKEFFLHIVLSFLGIIAGGTLLIYILISLIYS